jgi:hypothetical protein
MDAEMAAMEVEDVPPPPPRRPAAPAKPAVAQGGPKAPQAAAAAARPQVAVPVDDIDVSMRQLFAPHMSWVCIFAAFKRMRRSTICAPPPPGPLDASPLLSSAAHAYLCMRTRRVLAPARASKHIHRDPRCLPHALDLK